MMQTMKPYSEDLRRRIVLAAVRDGMSKSSAACLFGVSLSSGKRYFKIAKQGVSLAPRKGGGRPPKTDETVEKLLCRETPRRGRREASGHYRLRKAALPGVHHGHGPERLYSKAALKEAWLQPKKRTVGAMERDEWLRATWRVTVA